MGRSGSGKAGCGVLTRREGVSREPRAEQSSRVSGVYIPSHGEGQALETERHDNHMWNLRNETKTNKRDKQTLNYRGEAGGGRG